MDSLDPDDPDPRFAVGDRPVNRRTAARHRPAAPERPAALRRPVLSHVARHQLGAPLAERVAPSHRPRSTPVSPVTLACGVLGTAIAPMTLLGTAPWMQGLAGLAAVVLWGTAAWTLRPGRGREAARLGAAPAADTKALAALDRCLAEVAPELSAPTLEALQQTVTQLAGALQASQTPGLREGLRPQDPLYLGECVRRYLPDALTAYLRVPAALRDAPGAHGTPSATQALRGQLALVNEALAQQLARVAAHAGEDLVRQHRFLQAKADADT